MTKKEMFEAIVAKVQDNEEMVNFLNHEIELLSKKKTYTNSKKKAETAQRAELVYNALAEMENPVTVGELIKLTSNEEVASYNSQRVTALLRSLGDKVIKETVKGKTLYTIA